ncbi:hypothetical protein BLA28_03275 [Eisenbergiella tayi]|mgnify:CR=1 FL=1|uniref:Glycosyl hydrolases family 43 n=1 Tax=Eisenbergiella tayi TaxID=1432052 RepID=A0A1E3AXE7_9FIRM|nr:hypothetical protein [Eisenbergiella tayi]ODM13344.1 hypothetical protein BEH84_01059 [Eisenbergiella tayi]OIZ66018.1 hypothetical protein BLA28_03275 [Eisenbergiella tayi]
MKWNKKGLIYCPDGSDGWKNQFAMLPTPILLKDKLRIYLGFCDKDNVGRIGYIDVNPADPLDIYEISNDPVLDVGIKGGFDDNGVVPVSIIKNGNEIYLYYIGFQLGVKVPYYMFCGLAISEDGEKFTRFSQCPILERRNDEIFARCGVNVINDNGMYKMYYVGSFGDGWTLSDGKLKPLYTMKYLESFDGIHWDTEPINCMNFVSMDEHGFGRPYVWKSNDIYKMLYSIRTYSRGYYIGYAESIDGKKWLRKDEEAGIGVSENGWDNTNISYPYLFNYKDNVYLFYNGNGCGKSGVGYAVLEE